LSTGGSLRHNSDLDCMEGCWPDAWRARNHKENCSPSGSYSSGPSNWTAVIRLPVGLRKPLFLILTSIEVKKLSSANISTPTDEVGGAVLLFVFRILDQRTRILQ